MFPLRIDLGDMEVPQVSFHTEFVLENRGEIVWSGVVFGNDLVAAVRKTIRQEWICEITLTSPSLPGKCAWTW